MLGGEALLLAGHRLDDSGMLVTWLTGMGFNLQDNERLDSWAWWCYGIRGAWLGHQNLSRCPVSRQLRELLEKERLVGLTVDR